MNQISGPWGDELDAPWEAFRGELADQLESLAAGEVLGVGPGQGGGAPYVRFGLLEGKGGAGGGLR